MIWCGLQLCLCVAFVQPRGEVLASALSLPTNSPTRVYRVTQGRFFTECVDSSSVAFDLAVDRVTKGRFFTECVDSSSVAFDLAVDRVTEGHFFTACLNSLQKLLTWQIQHC